MEERTAEERESNWERELHREREREPLLMIELLSVMRKEETRRKSERGKRKRRRIREEAQPSSGQKFLSREKERMACRNGKFPREKKKFGRNLR